MFSWANIPRIAIAASLLSMVQVVHAQQACNATPFTAGPSSIVTVNGIARPSGFSEDVVDSNGVGLITCLTGSGVPDGTAANPCLFSPVEPASPLSVALGRGLEAFWFYADIALATSGPASVNGRIVMALESTFTSPTVLDGFQTQFQRFRVRINVNATGYYTVEHPWGSTTYQVTSLQSGNGLSKSEIDETLDLPFAAGQISAGLVTPFLKWDPAVVPAAPAGYLGDGNTPHAVVGSPCGRNLVRITALALDGATPIAIDPSDADGDGKTNSYASGLFTVMGQLALTTLSASRTGPGTGTVTSSPAGISCGATCSASFTTGTPVTLSAVPDAGSVFAGWNGGGCSGTGACVVTLDAATSVAAMFVVRATSPTLAANPAQLDFGGQSMGTTSPVQTITVVSIGTGPVTISSISTTDAQFAQANDCATLEPDASCTVDVVFAPATSAGALLSTVPVSAQLAVTSNGSGSPASFPLEGTGEKSLVTHYYQSILRRAPDGGGKAFWDSEAARMQAASVNVNEAWYAMAAYFYTSAEYLAFNRDDAGFVTDLYNTFFNRPPDGGGLAFWTGQLAAGLPREVVLAGFMFSPEFTVFTQAIFGDTAVRKEIDIVVDFYRGLLARLPDPGGLDFWVTQLRIAQCQGAAAVTAQAESISSQFATGGEYAARARTNPQYVGDLYNAFLRRGGDLEGVQFWINQIATGARTRENVRQQFVASPEFSARVAAVIAQGCLP